MLWWKSEEGGVICLMKTMNINLQVFWSMLVFLKEGTTTVSSKIDPHQIEKVLTNGFDLMMKMSLRLILPP